MSAGKRTSTDEPLTEHDVAERLSKAALRVVNIMQDARQIPGWQDAIKSSRYLDDTLSHLLQELQRWGVKP